eukprot:SAG31_NODE_2115_length_6416_cov_20.056989_6_plen_48_part_00
MFSMLNFAKFTDLDFGQILGNVPDLEHEGSHISMYLAHHRSDVSASC